MLPLEGLLVVAIEQAVAAPLCSARLAAAGARVIKVERPEGDFARGYDTAAKGESSYFTWLNQGKQSACIDFKSDNGASALWRIIEQADVLVQNLSPGALDRAGFSLEAMQAVNPQLIICTISGYGTQGEAAQKRAYDLLVQAESGLISVSGSPDALGRIGVSLCDIGAGVTAHAGILEALIKRGITGKGEALSVSLFDVAAEWMTVPFLHAEYGNGPPAPVGLRHPSIAPYGAFTCSDGRLVLISIQNEREWQRLCRDVLGAPQLADSPAYASNNLRVANLTQLEADISAVTESMTAPDFQARLEAANIAFGAINDAGDLRTHQAFRSVAAINALNEHLVLPAHPVVHMDNDSRTAQRCPQIGEHTQAILSEFSPTAREADK